MKKNLLIIGASGHGKVVADIALEMNKWETISFIDDNISIESSMGLKVIGTTKDIYALKDDYDVFVAIGNNSVREKILTWLEAIGATIPTLIHPKAIIGKQVEMEIGTVVMAGAVINCCTKIGKGCIVNTGATIDHDNYIDDYVHISPGSHIAGTVKIGKGTWLGIGSVVSNNVSITSNCVIGAGSLVVKNINESGTYVGVPVRRI